MLVMFSPKIRQLLLDLTSLGFNHVIDSMRLNMKVIPDSRLM